MGINGIDNVTENIEMSSKENILPEDINFEINEVTGQIFEILGDICPSCDSEKFEEGKCYDCGYGMQNEMEEIIKNKEFKKIEKSEKMKGIGRKIFLGKHDGKEISFYYYPNRLNENSLKIELLYGKIRIFYEVDLIAGHKKNFNGGGEYDVLSFKLKKPENFNGRHYILNSKTKKGIFFDFDLALRLAKLIFNKYYKNNDL